jgi:NTP pyrophosphatase (non-canonical NTP hydrolase)
MADLAEIQSRAWANKVAKGFNTTNVAHEFGLTWEELGEAFGAWRKAKPTFGEELADVVIFVAGLAEMTGVDLAAEVTRKLEVNEQRAYTRLPNGTPVKTGDAI